MQIGQLISFFHTSTDLVNRVGVPQNIDWFVSNVILSPTYLTTKMCFFCRHVQTVILMTMQLTICWQRQNSVSLSPSANGPLWRIEQLLYSTVLQNPSNKTKSNLIFRILILHIADHLRLVPTVRFFPNATAVQSHRMGMEPIHVRHHTHTHTHTHKCDCDNHSRTIWTVSLTSTQPIFIAVAHTQNRTFAKSSFSTQSREAHSKNPNVQIFCHSWNNSAVTHETTTFLRYVSRNEQYLHSKGQWRIHGVIWHFCPK